MQLICVGKQTTLTIKQTNNFKTNKQTNKQTKRKQLLCFGEHQSATESQLPDQVGTSKYKVQAMHTLCQKEEATKQADN